MSSLPAAAISAMISALQTAPAICSQIDRVRLRPMAKSTLQALVVRPAQGQAGEKPLAGGAPVLWTNQVALECYARATPGQAPDLAVDPLAVAAFGRLLADPSLAGVVLDIAPQGYSYDFDADGEQTVCLTLIFHIRQRSAGATFT